MTDERHRPFIKICCIADQSEANLAIAAGADALGLVSWMPSGPGVIDDDSIASIARNVDQQTGGRIQTFLLTALQTAAAIGAQFQRCLTTHIQLVDHVPVAELQQLRSRFPNVKLVQVIHVLDQASVAEALAVAPWVDMLLLDSGNPHLAVKELGGTGRTHNWTISAQIVDKSPVPVLLAGGLNPLNVGPALAAVRPFGFDLCSGVRTNETAGFTLDTGLLAAFVGAARRAGG